MPARMTFPPGVRVRIATEQDTVALHALYHAAYSVHADEHRPRTGGLKDSIEDVRGYVREQTVLLAEDADGQALATVTLKPIANLRRLAVAPHAKGAGLGSAMLEAGVEQARADGFGVAMLTTLEAHPWLSAFYARHGFEAYSVDKTADGNVWRQMRRRVRE